MKLKALESQFGDTSVNGGGGEEEEFKPTRAQRNGSMDLAPPSNCRVTSRRRNTMTSSDCVGTNARSNPVPREHSRMDRWAKSNAGGGKLPPSLSQVKVACAIADALSYLHQHAIVFRDLKP
eukprot:scaffold6012_cov223-Alexandrium_tamarense.AAC.1